MQIISGITSDPKQKISIPLPDGSSVSITLDFKPQQLGWFYSIAYSTKTVDFQLTGSRLVTSPNILRQYQKVIPFGLALITQGNIEPTTQTAFTDGAITAFLLLDQSDIADIEAAIYTGAVRKIYYNTEQNAEYTATCPDGSIGNPSVGYGTAPAGTYSSAISQDQANSVAYAAALAVATAQAEAALICFTIATLECRTRGGVAELCGYSEFVSPSTPPRKYRTITQNNSQSFLAYPDGACAGMPTGPFNCTQSASYSYNAGTCEITGGGTNNCGPVSVGPFSDSCGILATTTQTQSTQVIDPASPCCPSTFKYTLVSGLVELSEEDTDSDAITRLIAGPGGTWSDWTETGDGTEGTCIPASCCLARWEERTDGFDIEYQEGEWRVVETGLQPSTSYEIRVELWRRVFGVGSYTFYAYQYFDATSDGAGNLTESGDVANDQGFETYSAGAVLISGGGA